jgi:hypothetical protein
MVAYYPFNDNANDESGNGNNGTPEGGITWISDRFGNPDRALNFDGIDDYIDCGNGPSLQVDGDITVCAWVKEGFSSEQNPVIVNKYGGGVDAGWLLSTWPDGEVLFDGRDHSGIYRHNESDFYLDYEWHFLVGQRKLEGAGSYWRIYIDGILECDNHYENNSSINAACNIEIGRQCQSTNQWFKGIIDDIRIYNKALSESEIQELYCENGWCNEPPIANAGKDQFKIIGEIVQLDGSGSSDPDGDEISYAWFFNSKPDGSTAELGDNTIVNPTFIPDIVGEYKLGLVVNDGQTDSETDLVSIFVQSPQEATEDVITTVIEMNLGNWGKSLKAKLESIIVWLDINNTEDAIDQLEAFILAVKAQSGKKLTDGQASELIATAQRIIDALENNNLGKAVNSEYIDMREPMPTEYLLKDNYPNPFNPTTIISYAIPNDGLVILDIYDVLGNKVAELENGYKSAGSYDYNFDASNLTSGLYIYSLRVNDYTAIKKMMLLK